MSKDDLERIASMTDVLLALPPDRRSAALDALCAPVADAAIRREVERLLGEDAAFVQQLAALKPAADVSHPPTAAPHSSRSATASPGDQTFLPATVGRYHIRSRLGSGGMGEVYLAEQRSPIRRTVAVKLVKAGVDTRDVIARFDAERQALARMDHPNIARVIDAGATEAGRPYFVMEYVPGTPVTTFADDNRLTIRQRLALFAEICDAVAHAHTKGVIHRDIKPSNVLAYNDDGQPRVKIIDFGIAKALHNDRLSDATLMTDAGMVLGTYEYMSPEQAAGSLDVDTRSDVYSLGVLLYELLAGVKPFDRGELARRADEELRRIIRDVDPPRPSTRVQSLQTAARPAAADGATLATRYEQIARDRFTEPALLVRLLRRELEWIPLKAIRKERGRRYAGPSELAADVRSYLSGLPLLAAPESRTYLARKFVARHRFALAAAVTLLVLATAAVLFYVHSIRAEQVRTLAALTEAEKQRQIAADRRDAAVRAEAVAQAVSEFQTDMLGAADPLQGKGDQVTVVEMLDAAVAQLNAGSLRAQPLAEARVQQIVGQTYWSLARYPQAEPLLRAALATHRVALREDDDQIDVGLGSLGELMMTLRRISDAVEVYREIAERAIRLRGRTSWDALLARTRWINALVENNDAASAQAIYDQAAADIARNPAMDDNCRAELASANGKLLMAQKKYAEAESEFARLVELRKSGPPPTHFGVGMALSMVGNCQWRQAKFEDAEKSYRAAMAEYRSVPGDNPFMSRAMFAHAETLNRLNRFDEAIEVAQELLALRLRIYPPESDEVSQAKQVLAENYMGKGRYAEAIPLLREAMEIRRNLPGRQDAYVRTMLSLARALKATGALEEAEQIARAAVAFREDRKEDVAPAAAVLAEVLIARGRVDQAEAILRKYDVRAAAPATTQSR